MRKDEQNNWRIIYEELSALGHYPEHVDLIDAINSGDTKRADPLYTDERREIVEEVIFSYPGLIWLMLHVSPEETIIPIIVSQGKNLPKYFLFYLEKIPVNSFSVKYLRDEETGSIFYNRNSMHFTYKELIKRIEENLIGFVYFVLQDPNLDINDKGKEALEHAVWSDKNTYILEILLKDSRFIPFNDLFQYAAYDKRTDIVKVLLEDGRIDPNSYKYIITATWSIDDIELFRMLMEDVRIDPTPNGNDILQYFIERNNIEAVRIIVEDGRISVDTPDNNHIILAAYYNRWEILKLLLSDPRAQPSKNDNRAIVEAIKRKNIESLSILLNDPRTIIIDEDHSNRPIEANLLAAAAATNQEIADLISEALKKRKYR